MSILEDDPIWPHFRPLWNDLSEIAGPQLAIAGGYGLFLKQTWLIENADTRLVVPISSWGAIAPRATKDVDLVIGLDLIANRQLHELVLQSLQSCGFPVSNDEEAQRWTFEKALPHGKSIVIELHAPEPPDNHAELTSNRKKVKLRLPLEDGGYEARNTPAAAGFELNPFRFEFDDSLLTVVNPVTWATMKLLAMRSHREQSRRLDVSTDQRATYLSQAVKHANDVCRIIAMVTRDERDQVEGVINSFASKAVFLQASAAYQTEFAIGEWALQAVARNWTAEQIRVIQSVMDSWYRR